MLAKTLIVFITVMICATQSLKTVTSTLITSGSDNNDETQYNIGTWNKDGVIEITLIFPEVSSATLATMPFVIFIFLGTNPFCLALQPSKSPDLTLTRYLPLLPYTNTTESFYMDINPTGTIAAIQPMLISIK